MSGTNHYEYHPRINTGDQFGKWTVKTNKCVRRPNKHGSPIVFIPCECECGAEQEVSPSRLVNGSSKGCRVCTRSGSSHYKWEGVGRMSASVLYGIKANAKRKNRKVDLSLEYLWELFLAQNEKCALSGLQLDPWVSNNKKQGRRMSASLDRIDSNKDYIPGNVQWVHKDINKLKTDFDQDRFIELCKLIASHNE